MVTLEYSWVETSNEFPKIYKANGHKVQDFLDKMEAHNLQIKTQKFVGNVNDYMVNHCSQKDFYNKIKIKNKTQ